MKNILAAFLLGITVVTSLLVATSTTENTIEVDGNYTNNTKVIPFPTNQSNQSNAS